MAGKGEDRRIPSVIRRDTVRRVRADARAEITMSLHAKMVVAKGMLGLEWPDPFLTKVMTQIRDDLVPNA
jgi:hypothetical protein